MQITARHAAAESAFPIAGVLERNRTYIIAGMLIWAGDYQIMREYFQIGKEVL